MRIGDFAKICNTKISVLRHYDKEGLVIPARVDLFTGYRYYSHEQIPVFLRITALKKAGFSLLEIKKMLSFLRNDTEVLSLFQSKKSELKQMLSDLEEAQKIMLGETTMLNISFIQKNGFIQAATSKFDATKQNEAREILTKVILEGGYQRISDFCVTGEKGTNEVSLVCDVVKLLDKPIELNDNVDLPFENDEHAVGKWEIVGEYATKGDFYGDIDRRKPENLKHI